MPPATQAEAYANAHHPHPRREKGKPLFEWLSRKLGGRRATLAHINDTELRRGITNESEHSMRSYQNNNPYPSIPVPRRSSTVESSFMSRSNSELSRRTDDNASTRPIPPASPSPSTTLSPSASASVTSAPPMSPKTVKRNSASTASVKSMSTKPTTMSFDSGPHLGHIATQTPTLGSPARMFHNPQPQAVPDDNASMLTLASSTKRLRKAAAPPSVTWAPETNDRLSEHYAPSALSMRPRVDKDASTRGVRRRGSWSSDVSKWSCGPAAEAREGIVV